MAIHNVMAGVAVRDLEAAIAWYTHLLGRAPDAWPMDGLAEWLFASGGVMQLFHDIGRAGKSSVTLVEDDIAGLRARLDADGVTYSSADGDYVLTSILSDPEGNQVVFAQAGRAENRAAS